VHAEFGGRLPEKGLYIRTSSGSPPYLADLVESGKTRLHVVPEGANIGLGGAHAIASHNGLITVSLTTTMRDITSTAPDVVEETTEAFDLALGASMPAVQSLEFVRTREDIWRARA
jgi:hypothetical protein